METFNRYTLPNGLLVLLKENHNAPIISHWIWYRVGSRDETPGQTGISHWVEHMQFKGTPHFPSGSLDKAISRDGGFWNAYTYLDWTTYFETMPADKIDLALRLEADRMVNSLFDPTETESERTVIISERKGMENEPLFRLTEQVQAASFQAHSYHHEVIGELIDLQALKVEDLYTHYRKHYNPNNAVLALTGDFETANMLERVQQIYGNLADCMAPSHEIQLEPPQTEERQVIIEGPGETTYIEVAYHAPSASQPDFYPLIVADSLLSGPGNLNMFSEGISNKTSRLYRALVERELAVGIHGGLQATIDPFLHTFTTIVHPQSSAEAVIAALEAEILRLQETPPTQEELSRAVKQARALFAYGNERITNQAFWLGFSEMIASYRWYESYLTNLENVTPESVQRAAQDYLKPQNRTLGIYLPTGESAESEV